jgi:hypothetical protein
LVEDELRCLGGYGHRRSGDNAVEPPYDQFEFLHLDTRYRITGSSTSAAATTNESPRLTGPLTSFWFSNDCGQPFVDVAPTESDTSKSWFLVPDVTRSRSVDRRTAS